MEALGYVLGLDSSTQSLSAVLLDAEQGNVVHEYTVSYKNDSRLNRFGIDFSTMTIPPREEGEADQPPLMFVASLEAVFSDLKYQGIELSRIRAINISAQQHGHVYLNKDAGAALARLRSPSGQQTSNTDAAKVDVSDVPNQSLSALLKHIFAYPGAPIWKSANTGVEAAELRTAVGGSKEMIRLSGSDSPLRFSAAVIRRIGKKHAKAYAQTERILLINSFLNAILCGNLDQASDFGNASGMSLMDYSARSWSPELLEACSAGLEGGRPALEAKLGGLSHPLDSAGTLASWFVQRYGFSPDCKVLCGSGDNPQTKVLFEGDLLSLGTSFVFMMNADETIRDYSGAANSMYDGLGRPFLFACRTNGALVWDRIRSLHGIAVDDFLTSEEALEKNLPGSNIRLWQPDTESFPLSPAFALQRLLPSPLETAAQASQKSAASRSSDPQEAAKLFAADYAGLVDSALALIWHYTQTLSASSSKKKRGGGETSPLPLYLSGGPSRSKAIAERVASLWQREVYVIGSAGAALGAALAAVASLVPQKQRASYLTSMSRKLLSGAKKVLPRKDLVDAWHKADPRGQSTVQAIVAAFEALIAAPSTSAAPSQKKHPKE